MTQRRRRPNPAPRDDLRGRNRRPAAGMRSGPRRPARSPRGRKNWLWLLALPVLALAVWLMLKHMVFIVRDVRVAGAGNLAPEAVVRQSGIRLGGRMDDLDLEAIRNNVEATGQLAFVGVEKRYPSTLILNVRERTKDAIIMQASKLVVLDSDGYVVSAAEVMPEESVTYVTGLKPTAYRIGRRLSVNEANLSAMKAALEALKRQNGKEYVSELNVEDPDNITILTRTGMTVLLGDAEKMDEKIAWMVSALRDLESRGESQGRLDVSSGTKADYMPAATAKPKATATPEPAEPTPEPDDGIGDSAI